MDSILNTIKKMLGLQEDQTRFDTDIIIHINSVFMILNQMGVGPISGFKIEDDSTVWDEYIDTELPTFESVKTYIYLKVKLVFDPPLSSALLSAMKEAVAEYEWRLNVNAETPTVEEE